MIDFPDPGGGYSALAAAPPHRLALEFEAGPAWQSYNDVQIPSNDTATRVYLAWHLNEASDLRALYAPLTINEPGELAGPVSFAVGDFTAGQALATFKFNSYRLTYRHRFHEGERWSWWWDGTAKIRDARIALEQDGVIAAKDDLGFVPLLHISGEWRPAPDWRVAFDADEVYTFTWLHYAVASVRVDFQRAPLRLEDRETPTPLRPLARQCGCLAATSRAFAGFITFMLTTVNPTYPLGIEIAIHRRIQWRGGCRR